MGAVDRSCREGRACGQDEARGVQPAIVRRRRHGGRLALAALIVPLLPGATGPAGAASTAAPPPPSPGHYDFALSTRTFESPLFDASSSGLLRFSASQALPGSGLLSAWVQGGFPDYSTWFGVAAEGLAVGDWSLDANAGDFLLSGSERADGGPRLTDSFALRGAAVGLERGPVSFGFFGGKARYTLATPGVEASRPTLWGGEAHTRFRRSFVGGRLTAVEDAVYIDPARNGDRAVVASGSLVRRIGPRWYLFSDLLTTADVDLGFRTGAAYAFRQGELAASLYRFDEGFPVVYPLYRPGEQGLELRGHYRPTVRTGVQGNLRWVSEDALRDRRELRGSVGFNLQPVGRGPAVSVSYSRDDLFARSLLDEDVASVADRLAVTVGRYGSRGHLSGTLEHVTRSGDGGFDRGQALMTFRRVAGVRTTVDGFAVVQRDELANLGMTAEAAMERPLAGRYYWLAGLGAAIVERRSRAGEGVLRLGASRRIGRSGWHARIELRVPFSIGLERSYLNRQIAAIDVGNRFDWSSWDELRQALPGGGPPRGRLGGVVRMHGEGIGGLVVLVDGEPRGKSAADGSFHVRGVEVGEHRVEVDMRTLEPGLEIEGAAARTVRITRGGESRADFEVARFTALQGAVVTCDGRSRVGMRGVVLTLAAEGVERSTTSDNLGGFRFARVVPGVYRLAIVGGLEELPPPEPLRVDLGRDIFGFVIEVGCGDGAELAPGGVGTQIDR